jgi:hypothetical protein
MKPIKYFIMSVFLVSAAFSMDGKWHQEDTPLMLDGKGSLFIGPSNRLLLEAPHLCVEECPFDGPYYGLIYGPYNGRYYTCEEPSKSLPLRGNDNIGDTGVHPWEVEGYTLADGVEHEFTKIGINSERPLEELSPAFEELFLSCKEPSSGYYYQARQAKSIKFKYNNLKCTIYPVTYVCYSTFMAGSVRIDIKLAPSFLKTDLNGESIYLERFDYLKNLGVSVDNIIFPKCPSFSFNITDVDEQKSRVILWTIMDLLDDKKAIEHAFKLGFFLEPLRRGNNFSQSQVISEVD